jgi:Mrp family chromosome partitioning ATPase
LKQSAAAFSIAPIAQGILLVVAAGTATRDQIEQAQGALEASSCNLLGLVLNKRTEPVPKLINKYL